MTGRWVDSLPEPAVTGRWVDSLPEPAPAVWDLARLQVSALQWLVSALDAHDSGQAETCAIRLGWAGARIRAWRRSLHAHGAPDYGRCYDYADPDPRDLIMTAIRLVAGSHDDTTRLRLAEACLRTIWHRGQRS